MKFNTVDELQHFSFDDSAINELKTEDGKISFTFQGATVKADNSQNARFQDMFCGEIRLELEDADIVRIVKEGYKYYDANGDLQEQVPNQDVPAPAQKSVLERCAKGVVFTAVEDSVEDGFASEFGIDVPREDDEEEVDTYWLCIRFAHARAMWDRYCNPAEE
jgi:hypothetical protein